MSCAYHGFRLALSTGGRLTAGRGLVVQDRTFGDELHRLAYALDTVNETQLQRAYSAARNYVRRVLGVSKLELLIEVALREGRGLEPVLDRDDTYPAYPIKGADGQTYGLNAAAFELEKRLWVTVPEGDDDLALADLEPGQYEELWNRTPVTAEFSRIEAEERGYEREQARTLIAIPIFNSHRICRGVTYFESSRRLKPTDRVQQEFQLIADGIGRLQELKEQADQRREQTSKAVDRLANYESEYSFHYPYTPPAVFGIYPEGIDGNILTAVEEVVISRNFSWATWEQISEDGLVNEQVERRLREAKYLIAYLSEPEPETNEADEVSFVDNPNVLYELGLFRALTKVSSEPPTAALIIRERQAPRPPFDLAAYRRLEVPRENGSVDFGALRTALETYFDDMRDSQSS